MTGRLETAVRQFTSVIECNTSMSLTGAADNYVTKLGQTLTEEQMKKLGNARETVTSRAEQLPRVFFDEDIEIRRTLMSFFWLGTPPPIPDKNAILILGKLRII